MFFNICIPTLTKEVVKKSQKISVNKLAQTVKSVVSYGKQLAANLVPNFDFAPVSAYALA